MINNIKKLRRANTMARLAGVCQSLKHVINICDSLNKAIKVCDDRRKISSTGTPSSWEVKYVLDIKPGVAFNINDWNRYYENGMVVVQSKRTGQIYKKPATEVVAAARQEEFIKRIGNRATNPYGGGYGAMNPGTQMMPYQATINSNQQRTLAQSFDDMSKLMIAMGSLVTALSFVKNGTFAQPIKKAFSSLKKSQSELNEASKEMRKVRYKVVS